LRSRARELKTETKVNQARKIEEEKGSKENVSGGGRLSRKDRLDEYRREKLAAQKKLKAKRVVPFRSGV